MAATNMPKISLLNKLTKDFPDLIFSSGQEFLWSAPSKTITYNPQESTNFELLLLHELAHANLSHTDYTMDIELLNMESAAWDKVTLELAPKYKIPINEDYIQDQLDTYRDWMHKRSLCPKCEINGFQQSDLGYKCPACGTIWRPNEAKFTHLRRYNKK